MSFFFLFLFLYNCVWQTEKEKQENDNLMTNCGGDFVQVQDVLRRL